MVDTFYDTVIYSWKPSVQFFSNFRLSRGSYNTGGKISVNIINFYKYMGPVSTAEHLFRHG